MRLVDDEIKEVEIGAGDHFVQNALALRKREDAGFDFGKMTSRMCRGNVLLRLTNHAFGTLGTLVSLEDGRSEDKIASTTTEVAGFVDENFDHGAIIAVLKNITKHKRDGWRGNELRKMEFGRFNIDIFDNLCYTGSMGSNLVPE